VPKLRVQKRCQIGVWTRSKVRAIVVASLRSSVPR
jgi:hypothetical protein